jgi:hypothetical protein
MVFSHIGSRNLGMVVVLVVVGALSSYLDTDATFFKVSRNKIKLQHAASSPPSFCRHCWFSPPFTPDLVELEVAQGLSPVDLLLGAVIVVPAAPDPKIGGCSDAHAPIKVVVSSPSSNVLLGSYLHLIAGVSDADVVPDLRLISVVVPVRTRCHGTCLDVFVLPSFAYKQQHLHQDPFISFVTGCAASHPPALWTAILSSPATSSTLSCVGRSCISTTQPSTSTSLRYVRPFHTNGTIHL